MSNQVVWFDIPVKNLDRAILFYSQVLAVDIKKEIPDMPIGVLPHQGDDVGGCLFQGKEEGEEPSNSGPLLYFNVKGRLDEAVNSTNKYGGKILKAKHAIGPYGFRAIILDSEGNRIALHSPS